MDNNWAENRIRPVALGIKKPQDLYSGKFQNPETVPHVFAYLRVSTDDQQRLFELGKVSVDIPHVEIPATNVLAVLA